MAIRPVAALLSVFAFEACAHEKVLEPAAGASLAPGQKDVAETAVAGVTLEVSGDSWQGDPQNLGSVFTPVRVTLRNGSGKALLVSHQDFKLSGRSGTEYAAITPNEARGLLAVAPQSPYAGFERDPMGVMGPQPIDDAYYGSSPEQLPTADMLSHALPEGIVQDGENVTGFLYFPSVTGSEPAVTLDMTLSNGSDGQAFGHIAIPFQTSER
jgi:hypothetical protein